MVDDSVLALLEQEPHWRLADCGVPALAHDGYRPELLASGAKAERLRQAMEADLAAHPGDPRRIPGGSSGGSAGLVAAGVVPLALGSDSGGSTRQPAALCGVYGLKPTYGRLSRRGLIALASSTDCVGLLAADPADLALLFGLLAGHDAGDPTSRPHPPPRSWLLRLTPRRSCHLPTLIPVSRRRVTVTANPRKYLYICVSCRLQLFNRNTL
jgi:hypothetical protein